MSDFVNFLGRPGTAQGTLGEPKNSLKIDFLRKNGVPNVLFRRFLCTKLVSTIFARFFVDFSRIGIHLILLNHLHGWQARIAQNDLQLLPHLLGPIVHCHPEVLR